MLFSHLGLNSPELFKSDGDKKVIQQLVSSYNQGKHSNVIFFFFLGKGGVKLTIL